MNPYMELPLLHQRFQGGDRHTLFPQATGSAGATDNATSQAISELAYRAIEGIERWAGRLVENYRLWRRTRHAVQELSGLDDRMLKDIGIDRSEIRSVVLETVRAGRAPADVQTSRVDRIVSLPRRLPEAANTNELPSRLESA